MPVNVKELSDEELERRLDELRSTAPTRTTKPKTLKKKKAKTVSESDAQEKDN